MMNNSWFNNKICNLDDVRISPLDFGFIHSDATYDVLRTQDGKICFYNMHYERFVKSCEFYSFKMPNKTLIEQTINQLLRQTGYKDAFVWLCKWKGTPPSGSPRDMNAPENFLIYVKPYYEISDEPVSMTICDDLPRAPGYQEYKNFSWVELSRAQRFSGDDFDTALVRDTDGNISEGPGFGVCFVKDNEVYTPGDNVLPSITIKVVEKMCDNLGIPFHRSTITNYNEFDECFICSTSGGLTRVSNINDTAYRHDVTNKLRDEYDDICRYGWGDRRF